MLTSCFYASKSHVNPITSSNQLHIQNVSKWFVCSYIQQCCFYNKKESWLSRVTKSWTGWPGTWTFLLSMASTLALWFTQPPIQRTGRSHFPGPSGGTYEGDYSLPPHVGVKTCQGIPPTSLRLHARKVKLPLCMLWKHGGGGLQVQLFRIKVSFKHWRWSSIYPHNKSNLLTEYNASHDKRLKSWQHHNQDRGSSCGTK